MMHIIETERIVRVQSISNYSKLFFNNGKTLVVAKLLRWFEENLPSGDFARVHRTHLVNMNYISQFRLDTTESSLRLVNGEQIDVSKRRKQGFLKILQSRA
jgi:two-component system LytT family response regulator